MLRKLLTAAALLVASGASFAHGGDYGYGRVISVEPSFTISFGTRAPDGFRVLYESGGYRYWTHTPYYPGRTIVVPAPYPVERVYYGGYRRDWDDRRWDDRGWRRERWEHRHRHHDDDDD
ncbi:hypothetical protein [Thiobacillus sedimenti]|uniref:Uncharacterized protein n=1 Tax=Thiobacillus sedimenti TaxID=3110231 RepID=A0ABZ1CHF8_9PROT|nr:hypothetical protein [Thiobacillus sp. SCUT-2]WRS38822.1 hypothetical protein VA613_12545 [Thiobacillus sp. SCUT-2]